MVFKSIFSVTCICLVVVSFNIDAALVGRLASTPGGTDYQAYYDDESDLTWLADANAAVGSSYDTLSPGSGTMNWYDANAWAAGLDIGGVTGWRLPDSDTCYEYNCADSEMGNLFYNVLGGSEGNSITTTHNANYYLFNNVQSYPYWSSAEYIDPDPSPDGPYAGYFSMYDGYQLTDVVYVSFKAWGVHSGDVSAVPVPGAVWLFGSGLLGLMGMARRKACAEI